jgi:hypothetical protein
MDKQLFRAMTDEEPMTDKQLNDILEERGMDATISDYGEEWMPMARLSLHMDLFKGEGEPLEFVRELGAGTTLVLLGVHSGRIVRPDLIGDELVYDIMRQDDDIGRLVRYLDADGSLDIQDAEVVKDSICQITIFPYSTNQRLYNN